MATYTAITDAEIDQDSPITQTLMTKYRDNLTAVVEIDSNALPAPGVWHPYDMDNVGDGATGIIYDQAVDGNVNEVVSPDFENLYEYMFLFSISCNIQASTAGVSSAGLNIDLYLETDAAYSTGGQILDSNSSGTSRLEGVYGQVYIIIPRITKRLHEIDGKVYAFRLNGTDGVVDTSGAVYDGTDQKILRVRFQRYASTGLSGNINGGTIKMFRRRIAVE